MTILLNLIRSDLREFTAYSSARDMVTAGNIWLNANESPFDDTDKINRYPDKQAKNLLSKIAELCQVKENQIMLSRGSDEAIDLLIRLFCTAGKDAIMTCTPTYGMYRVSAKLQGASVIEVPLEENSFAVNLPAIFSAWQPSVKIIFLCSPNNPTGNLLKKSDILRLCEKFADSSMIVLDEAYIDFADSPSLMKCIDQFDNLIVLRTFSKAYGMAGARFGFLVANPCIIQWLLKIIAPYPLSSLVTDYVLKIFSPERLAVIQQQIDIIKSERSRILSALTNSPHIEKIWPSQANYLLCKMPQAEKIMQHCLKQGMVLRSMFDKLGLENCIRISIGLPAENDQVIRLFNGEIA